MDENQYQNLQAILTAYKTLPTKAKLGLFALMTAIFSAGIFFGPYIAAHEIAYYRTKLEARGSLLVRAKGYVNKDLKQEIDFELYGGDKE